MALPTGKCSENGLAEEEDESDRLARASALAFYEIICPSNDVSICVTEDPIAKVCWVRSVIDCPVEQDM